MPSGVWIDSMLSVVGQQPRPASPPTGAASLASAETSSVASSSRTTLLHRLAAVWLPRQVAVAPPPAAAIATATAAVAPAAAKLASAAAAAEKEHLVVMVHGLYGVRDNWKVRGPDGGAACRAVSRRTAPLLPPPPPRPLLLLLPPHPCRGGAGHRRAAGRAPRPRRHPALRQPGQRAQQDL